MTGPRVESVGVYVPAALPLPHVPVVRPSLRRHEGRDPRRLPRPREHVRGREDVDRGPHPRDRVQVAHSGLSPDCNLAA